MRAAAAARAPKKSWKSFTRSPATTPRTPRRSRSSCKSSTKAAGEYLLLLPNGGWFREPLWGKEFFGRGVLCVFLRPSFRKLRVLTPLGRRSQEPVPSCAQDKRPRSGSFRPLQQRDGDRRLAEGKGRPTGVFEFTSQNFARSTRVWDRSRLTPRSVPLDPACIVGGRVFPSVFGVRAFE